MNSEEHKTIAEKLASLPNGNKKVFRTQEQVTYNNQEFTIRNNCIEYYINGATRLGINIETGEKILTLKKAINDEFVEFPIYIPANINTKDYVNTYHRIFEKAFADVIEEIAKEYGVISPLTDAFSLNSNHNEISTLTINYSEYETALVKVRETYLNYIKLLDESNNLELLIATSTTTNEHSRLL